MVELRKVAYPVWDRTTRAFHWINALAVLLLIGIGVVILYAKPLGVSGDGKVLLKTLHVYVGYFFAINLVWRLIWAFAGGAYARWKALLPGGRGYVNALRAYVKGFLAGQPPTYLGHNPLARAMVSLILLALVTQASTGLILAGTDLYMPPFGNAIADWVTDGDSDRLASLQPGSKEYVDPESYASMRELRKPIITTHLYVFYLLLGLIALHLVAVVVTELRERSGLVSAMLTGEKMLTEAPQDKLEQQKPQ